MEQTKIKHIEAGEILDSRGNPTVATTVVLSGGAKAGAAVPSGASTGALEAHELRDNNADRYNGMGVLKACSNVNVKISHALEGLDAQDQELIDKTMIELDGTENKEKLGANAILSVSLACSRAVSNARGLELYESLRESFGFGRELKMPYPIMNLINGGKHASTNIGIQEFQIIPLLGGSISEKIESGAEIFHALGKMLEKEGMDSDVGNEGGYAPDVESIDQVFELLRKSIQSNNFKIGQDIAIGIDSASNCFYNSELKQYTIAPPEKIASASELSAIYNEWIEKYNLSSIEDPFAEESWQDWSSFLSNVPGNVSIIGDDLLATNKDRLKQAIDKKAVNTILIKPNQIGTLTETMNTIKLAQENNIKIAVSHRSGETNDAFISDLAVAVGADYLKAGAPSRGERVAKYNRLKEIETQNK